MFSFVVNFIVMIFVFSIIFFIMSYLQIQMNVELTFKPIYKPLLAESLAISISNSDVRDDLLSYYFGKTSGEGVKNTLRRVITKNKYLICIESKCIGDSRIKGEESILPLLTNENRKMNIKVVIA